jgi:hypothetical protein
MGDALVIVDMADLKKSDVTDAVGSPDEFETVTVDFGGLKQLELDVHEGDSIEEILEEHEKFLKGWEGFFNDV